MIRPFPRQRARALYVCAGLALGYLPMAAPAAPPSAAIPDAAEHQAAQPKASQSQGKGEDEPGAVVELDEPTWIKHTIVTGESLRQIADRYQVTKDQLIRWNKLDKNKPKIFAGKNLRVKTSYVPPPRRKLFYVVKRGDAWNKIAQTHHVDPDLMARWNPKSSSRKIRPGQELVIWVDPLDDPRFLPKPPAPKSGKGEGAVASEATPGVAQPSVPNLPLIAIPTGSVSVGKPSGGKIVNSVQLPDNRKLYTIRKPDEAYGSSFALGHLQTAVAWWRHNTGYTGALMIGSISKRGGGKLSPHSSHRSGRDVDIRLPLEAKGSSADKVSDVDWDALWGLVTALIDTGAVKTIYLTTDRQKHLHAAAKRAGASKATIGTILQYPESKGHKNGIVRHSSGHTAHIHVRFTCADNETRCED